MVLVLGAELSYRQGKEALSMGLKAVPVHQNVEQRHCITEMRLEHIPTLDGSSA